MFCEWVRATCHKAASQTNGARPFFTRATLVLSKARRSMSFASLSDVMLVVVSETRRGLDNDRTSLGMVSNRAVGTTNGWVCARTLWVEQATTKRKRLRERSEELRMKNLGLLHRHSETRSAVRLACLGKPDRGRSGREPSVRN